MEFREALIEKSNTELLKMVYEFDTWSPNMLTAVETELSTRNILPPDIADTKKKLIEQERRELSKGKEASLVGLIIGWLTVFGFFGIIIGYNFAYGKNKSKYTGDDYFKYDETSRENGTKLFYTSLLLTSIGLIYKFVPHL